MIGFGKLLKDYLEYYKISQVEFAERLEITQKHLNEILNDKTNLSVELMIAISLLTDIDVNLIAYAQDKKNTYEYLHSNFKDDKEIKDYLNNFYLNDISKNKWIVLKNKDDITQNYLDLKEYLGIKDIDNYSHFLEKQFSFKKNDPNINMKTFLFITHCNHLIKGLEVPDYSSSNIPNLLEELRTERCKKFNKDNLINIFKKYGIVLVIEEPLKGTKLRGCCRVKIKTPVIYLTTLYKNTASLYFALYHEIGHIKRDYNKLKNKTYEIDDEEAIDKYAINQMIDDKVWNILKEKPNNYKELCKNNNIPLSFYYSRLAYEGIISYKSKEYNNNMDKIEL